MKHGRVKWFLVLAVTTVAGAWIIFRRSPGPQITGKVILKGTPPPEIAITLDPQSAKLQPNGMTTRHYVVAADGGLANAFVYVKKGLEGRSFPPAKGSALVEFRRNRIEPYVTGIRTNQPVRFRNRDPFVQNFHCTPGASSGNREFNIAFAPPSKGIMVWTKELLKGRLPWKAKTFTTSFSAPDVFLRFKCDVHPWEFGYIGVVEHPFFAVTGSDGTFRFPPGLPPGKYVIEARHLKAGVVTQEVTFGKDEIRSLTFTLEAPPRR
jgi:hypothetical protein